MAWVCFRHVARVKFRVQRLLELKRVHACGQVCDECAATRTPLWRTMGEQTLCNACGLRRKRAAAAHHMREKRARWVERLCKHITGRVSSAGLLLLSGARTWKDLTRPCELFSGINCRTACMLETLCGLMPVCTRQVPCSRGSTAWC